MPARSEPPSASAGAHAKRMPHLKPLSASACAHVNSMPHAQGRYRQSQEHMPMHCRTLNAASGSVVATSVDAAHTQPPAACPSVPAFGAPRIAAPAAHSVHHRQKPFGRHVVGYRVARAECDAAAVAACAPGSPARTGEWSARPAGTARRCPRRQSCLCARHSARPILQSALSSPRWSAWRLCLPGL